MSSPALFAEFEDIVRRLRKECPWDREQTHKSLRPSLVEETYEVVESIEENDMPALKGELGDLLLHILLQAVIAEEEQAFTLPEVITGISEKMVRRHPHVFGSVEADSADAVVRNWEHIKMDEGRDSVLDGVPAELPALLRAARLQEKASKVGFDWKEKNEVWAKVTEEIGELEHAEASGDPHRIEDEFGDLLFALVNYSRFIRTNPEFALRRACDKFTRRFRFV
jgi:MazG family protein